MNFVEAAESAQSSAGGQLLTQITASIVNPIIILFFVGALCVFVFGMFEFIKGADSDEARSKGQQHMIWGIIGMFIMVSTFAIIRIIANTFGIDVPWIIGGGN